MTSETRACQNCQTKFIIASEDFAFYQKMQVPAPGLCPICRFKRRAQFRNERTLYNRTCAKCGKAMISMYHPDLPYIVWCTACFDADNWDPYDYGVPYDFNRPFLEQFYELMKRVPKKTLYNHGGDQNINSEYTNVAGWNKNCYLLFNSGYNEDCLYSRGIKDCRDTVDAYYGEQLELCYEIISGQKSTGVVYGQNVHNCLDSFFLIDSMDCANCFGCVNLRHKNYYFFNKPLAKEEWHRRVNEIRGSYAKMQQVQAQFAAFLKTQPRKENANLKTEDSTGNYLYDTKDCQGCFETMHSERSKYLFSVKLCKDSYDLIGFGFDSELLLENVGVGRSYRVFGSYWVDHSHEIAYSFCLDACDNCIGCDRIRKGRFVILNKRYTEQEYKKIQAHIEKELRASGQWGLFMPPSLAPFAYNETIAQDEFPLTREQALAQGFRWRDDLPGLYGKTTLKSTEIPDHIKDVHDSLVDEILVCTTCGKNYKIVKAELAFYRKMILSIPRQCFDCRHRNRLRRRGPFALLNRTCAKCGKNITTAHTAEQASVVYCETCYTQEII